MTMTKEEIERTMRYLMGVDGTRAEGQADQALSYEEQEARSLQALDAASIATLDQMKAEADARADTIPPVADGQLTVAQLVAILATLPQDLPVEVEGCDCYGYCTGAIVEQSYVLITR